MGPIANVNQNRTGSSSFLLTPLSCKRNSVHNAPVCRPNTKKRAKISSPQSVSNPADSSVNEIFVSGGQEGNSLSKKKKHKMDPAKELCNNPVHRCVNKPFVSRGQEPNNLSSKKKKHKMDPAKDLVQ